MEKDRIINYINVISDVCNDFMNELTAEESNAEEKIDTHINQEQPKPIKKYQGELGKLKPNRFKR